MGSRRLKVAGVLVLAGCGNNWISADSRTRTPTALTKSGSQAYDRLDFPQAINYFAKALEQDPSNANVRVRLTYSYNALAGLTPLNLIKKISGFTTATPAAGGSATSGQAQILSMVGLAEDERKAIVQANPGTLADWRSLNTKLGYLDRGWRTVCPLIPKETLDAVVGGSDLLRKLLAVDTDCQGGLPDKSLSPNAAIFAAAMLSMAQAAALYQTVLDRNGDGQIAFVKEAQTRSDNIKALQAQAADLKAGVDNLSLITNLNENISALNNIRAFVDGDLFSLTIAGFDMVPLLVSQLVLPADVQASITGSIKKFSESKDSLNKYLSVGKTSTAAPGAPPDATQVQMVKNAVAAAATVDKLYDKQTQTINNNKDLTPQQKTEATQKLNTQITSVCTNFSTLKASYGLPPDTQKPASCTTVATPTLVEDPEAKSQDNEEHVSMVEEQTLHENEGWEAQDVQSDQSAHEDTQGILEMAKFGHLLIRAL